MPGSVMANSCHASQTITRSPLKRKRSQSQSDSQSPAKKTDPIKNGYEIGSGGKIISPVVVNLSAEKPKWNPRDAKQMGVVKEALHISTAPTTVICREMEQKRILEFSKTCLQQEKAGSLYVCGCPGTGKTLSINKVKDQLVLWSQEEAIQSPDILSINCTSLTKTSEIFSKMLEKFQPLKKMNGGSSPLPLPLLQNLFSQKGQSSHKMMLVIVDEMDYLITKDRAVLHDLFMLTTLPFSKCILIGIANAIDLADRFLPKLESLNCKPMVITFPAYSKDQILKILCERLSVLQFHVFEAFAIEFCARKVAAASGDMRRALDACRSALEVLEAELRDTSSKQNADMVRLNHMDIALSRAFKSSVVEMILSLPQHQQIILCSMLKLQKSKKSTGTVGDLNREYSQICKLTQMPAVGVPEFINMCNVLADQGLLALGKAKEDKLKRVTLKIDPSDISFALKGVRYFRNCLN